MSSQAAAGVEGHRPDEADSLTGLDAQPKVVFSSTLREPLAWPNTRLVDATGEERVDDGYPDVALELAGSRTLDGRLQLLDHVPTVPDGPPGAG